MSLWLRMEWLWCVTLEDDNVNEITFTLATNTAGRDIDNPALQLQTVHSSLSNTQIIFPVGSMEDAVAASVHQYFHC